MKFILLFIIPTVSLSDDNTQSQRPYIESISSTTSPPEVTTSVPLGMEPSSNYLPVNGKATPRDRGGDEDGSDDWTSSGLPAADLREAEGKLNREADGRTTSNGTPPRLVEDEVDWNSSVSGDDSNSCGTSNVDYKSSEFLSIYPLKNDDWLFVFDVSMESYKIDMKHGYIMDILPVDIVKLYSKVGADWFVGTQGFGDWKFELWGHNIFDIIPNGISLLSKWPINDKLYIYDKFESLCYGLWGITGSQFTNLINEKSFIHDINHLIYNTPTSHLHKLQSSNHTFNDSTRGPTNVPLSVVPSPNSLPVNGKVTPGGRGDVGVSGDKKHHNKNNPHDKDNEHHISPPGSNNMTSSVQPVADLREAEGKLNREGSTPSGKTSDGGGILMAMDEDDMLCVDSLFKWRLLLPCICKRGLISMLDDERLFTRSYYRGIKFIVDGDNSINFNVQIQFIIKNNKLLKDFNDYFINKTLKSCSSINNSKINFILNNGKFKSQNLNITLDINELHKINTIYHTLINYNGTDNLNNIINSGDSFKEHNDSTPEVTNTVGLADSSSNYLSLKSRATPRDRGGSVEDVTLSEPAADLREAEGEVNRRGSTPSGKTSDGVNSSSNMVYERCGEFTDSHGVFLGGTNFYDVSNFFPYRTHDLLFEVTELDSMEYDILNRVHSSLLIHVVNISDKNKTLILQQPLPYWLNPTIHKFYIEIKDNMSNEMIYKCNSINCLNNSYNNISIIYKINNNWNLIGFKLSLSPHSNIILRIDLYKDTIIFDDVHPSRHRGQRISSPIVLEQLSNNYNNQHYHQFNNNFKIHILHSMFSYTILADVSKFHNIYT